MDGFETVCSIMKFVRNTIATVLKSCEGRDFKNVRFFYFIKEKCGDVTVEP